MHRDKKNLERAEQSEHQLRTGIPQWAWTSDLSEQSASQTAGNCKRRTRIEGRCDGIEAIGRVLGCCVAKRVNLLFEVGVRTIRRAYVDQFGAKRQDSKQEYVGRDMLHGCVAMNGAL